MTPEDRDRQRRRWAEARRIDQLDPAGDEAFAVGGLGGHVESLDLRIRFLPADPLATPVRLDEDAEEWLSRSRSAPYGGREAELGNRKRATSAALVRFDVYRDDDGWKRFTALHGDGGLDYGEGSSLFTLRGGRFVHLRQVVGLIWHLATMQADATERWGVEGPFELSIALANVEGAGLGGFAEGWRDVTDGLWDMSTCIEPDVLLRFELDALEPEALAMDVGERLENTFGSAYRRFLAARGDLVGRFDPRF
jgi:hypothetical protein